MCVLCKRDYDSEPLACVCLLTLALAMFWCEHPVMAQSNNVGAEELPAWAKCREPAPPPAGKKPFVRRPYVGLDPNDKSKDYLNYAIPKDAVKKGPHGTRDGDRITFSYFDPKAISKRHPKYRFPLHVAREEYSLDGKVLLARGLSKGENDSGNALPHGIQREWYENGKPKSESPYKNGIMHGTFKQWDKDGRLIACYKMNNGEGVKKVYYPNGRLECEIHYRENEENGPVLQFFESGHMSSMSYKVHDHFLGNSVGFFPDGALHSWTMCDMAGELDGPFVEFTPEGEVRIDTPEGKVEKEVQYYIHGKKVTPEEYQAEAKKDQRLPKYESDPQKYKDYIMDEIKTVVAKYKDMPPVKIPLECKDDDASR